MTKLQKLKLEQSKHRETVNRLLAKTDDLNDAERAELSAGTERLITIEPEIRAAMVADEQEQEEREAEMRSGANGDGEPAEHRRLLERVSIREYVGGATPGAVLNGAAHELNAAVGIDERQAALVQEHGGGQLVPWQLFDAVVERADEVTATSELAGSPMRRPILARIFAPSILGSLGVRIDNAAGEVSWPILTSGAVAAAAAEKATVEAAKGGWSTIDLKPKRLASRLRWTAEQQAAVGRDLEVALRRDILAAINNQTSADALNGNGTAPQVTGLLGRVARPARGSTVTYETMAGFAAEGVDGVLSQGEQDNNVLMSVDVYAKLAGTYRSGVVETAMQALRARARSVRTTAHLASGPTTGGAAARQDEGQVIIHLGGMSGRGDSVAAMFTRGVVVIRDSVTDAAEAVTNLTAYILWDAYMALRPAYKRLSPLLA